MASGTILKLYRTKVNAETVSPDLYQKYIETANKRHEANSMFSKHNPNGDKVFYPRYMGLGLDNNQPLVYVSNFNPDRFIKPNPSELKYADCIGETGFNSTFRSLPEYWDLNAYDPARESHFIDMVEAVKISKAIHYLKDGVYHLKVSDIIEKYAQQDNEFFKPLADMLPSYTFPKEFKRKEADLVEEEEMNQAMLGDLVTMVDFYVLMMNEQEIWEVSKHYLYDLVMIKW